MNKISSTSVTVGLSRFNLLLTPLLTLVGCVFPANSPTQSQNYATPDTAQTSAIARPQPSPSASLETTPAMTSAVDAEMWSRLREGTGYVVLLRHAQTVAGTGDPPGFCLEDCATQRNLSAEGREQAIRIGQAFKQQNINVVQVVSSQYCRCLETARLMDVGTVEPAPMLNSIFEDRSTADTQLQQTNQQILNHRGKPGVIVMVTHYANISALSGVAPQSGDAVVVRGEEQGAIAIAGQLQDL